MGYRASQEHLQNNSSELLWTAASVTSFVDLLFTDFFKGSGKTKSTTRLIVLVNQTQIIRTQFFLSNKVFYSLIKFLCILSSSFENCIIKKKNTRMVEKCCFSLVDNMIIITIITSKFIMLYKCRQIFIKFLQIRKK